MSDRLKEEFELNEIDETEEAMQEQEDRLFGKLSSKDIKRKMPLLKNDRANFHSGEYYKGVDLENKMQEKCQQDIQVQSQEAENKFKSSKKNRFNPEGNRQVGGSLTSEY